MKIKFEDEPVKAQDGTWIISKKDEDAPRLTFFRENVREALCQIIEHEKRIAEHEGEEPCFAPGLEKILRDEALFDIFLSISNPTEKAYLYFAELVIDKAFYHFKERYNDAVDDFIGIVLIKMNLMN